MMGSQSGGIRSLKAQFQGVKSIPGPCPRPFAARWALGAKQTHLSSAGIATLAGIILIIAAICWQRSRRPNSAAIISNAQSPWLPKNKEPDPIRQMQPKQPPNFSTV